MPDEEQTASRRERIAVQRARNAFGEVVDSERMLAELPFAELWFAPGVGEVGLFTDDNRVVMVQVDINDMGHTVRAGPLDRRLLAVTDAAGAAQTLKIPTNESEQLLGRIEQSLRVGITAYDNATVEYDLEQRRLTKNMTVLTDGLERIQRNYSAYVTLAHEDPLTFGGGHLVLYAVGNTRSRFTIEEQYADTDWSEPERLPTSWTWRAERFLPRRNGDFLWRASTGGEVQSDDAAVLLSRAAAWARRSRDTAMRAEELKQAPPSRRPPEAPQL